MIQENDEKFEHLKIIIEQKCMPPLRESPHIKEY
jgi:hypothetical protein